MYSLLLENALRNEHPLDGVRIGFEFEFAYYIDVTDAYEDYLQYAGHYRDYDYEYDEENEEDEYRILSLNEFIEQADLLNIYELYENIAKEYAHEKLPKYFDLPEINEDWIWKNLKTDRSINGIYRSDGILNVHIGLELPTPILTAPSGIELYDRIDEVLNSFAEFLYNEDGMFKTTDGCGLHVNMSLEDYEMTMEQRIILFSLFDVSYMLDAPHTREKYATSTIKALKASLGRESYDNLKKALTRRDRELLMAFMKDLDELIRTKKMKSYYPATLPKEDYVEFRALGGAHYEDRIEDIKRKIVDMALKLKKSRLPEIGKRAKRKLYKILTRILEDIKTEKTRHDKHVNLPPSLTEKEKHLVDVALSKFPENEPFTAVLKQIKSILSRSPNDSSLASIDIVSYVGSLVDALEKMAKSMPEKYGKYMKLIDSLRKQISEKNDDRIIRKFP